MKSIIALGCAALLAVGANAATSASNDIDVLNYALTLEHLEATFYGEFNAKFNASAFNAAKMPPLAFQYLNTIGSQEAAHVNILSTVIKSLGGSPVAAGTYNFSGVTSVETYLAYARILENTGVSAYDGAVNLITNPTIAEVAATIATVEARHAAYLNQLNDLVPFPNVTDPTLTVAQVVTAITPLVVTLPNITAPTARNLTSDYTPETAAEATNDLNVLNYALSLEHIGDAFYKYGQATFNDSAFTAASFPNNTYDYFGVISSHESAHVAALTSIIESLNGTAVPVCTYNFSSVTTVQQYVQTAATFETTDQEAYDGAVNMITNPTLQEAAATIATVEARQSAYILNLLSQQPFPYNTDLAKRPDEIEKIVAPFIVSCNFTATTPTYPPGFNSSVI